MPRGARRASAIAHENRVPIMDSTGSTTARRHSSGWPNLGNPYVSVADPEGSAGIDWGVYGAPETFLIDPNGRVIKKHVSQ
jgi:cytochrome c biogenesis protein CcmG/thiol:disulfide interchange protein DsbE